MRSGQSAAVLGLATLLTGCAAVPAGPVRLDCRALRMAPVAASARRVTFAARGFSVVLPTGEHWCISYTDSNGVAFGKNLLGGETLYERPPESRMRHTFGAIARALDVKSETFSTRDALRRFVDEQFIGGRGPGRFKRVAAEVVDDDGPGRTCVRFRAVLEEHDNPIVPGEVLIQDNRGLVCRHPGAAHLVHVGYSERYLRRAPPATPLADTLGVELEPFLQSLEFMPPR